MEGNAQEADVMGNRSLAHLSKDAWRKLEQMASIGPVILLSRFFATFPFLVTPQHVQEDD